MKRAIFILILALALILCLGMPCLASGVEEGESIKTYITEKIVPVAAGVLTSVMAFIVTLGAIAKSLKSLKETKDAFKDEAKERAVFFENGVMAIKDTMLDLENMLVTVPNMEIQLRELTEECGVLAEILSLGFSANSEIIKSGKGKKMAILLENANKRHPENASQGRSAIGTVELMQGSDSESQCKMQNAQLTTLPSTALTPPLNVNPTPRTSGRGPLAQGRLEMQNAELVGRGEHCSSEE